MSVTGADCAKVVDNGADSQRFVIVITGDGFAAAELDAFHTASTSLIEGLRAIDPVGWRLQDAFNVYRLDTVSAQSGVSVGAGCSAVPVSKTTSFGATLCGDGQSTQCLTVDAGKVAAALLAAGLTWHLVVVIANTKTAATSMAGNICAVTLDAGGIPAVGRAIGRIAAGLAVEYADIQKPYPSTQEPSAPNLTLDRTGGKWRADITPGFELPSSATAPGWSPWMVGAFEGGGNYATGIFRPSETCLMREDKAPFCYVCFRALQKALMPYHQTTGLSWLASLSPLGQWSAVRAVSPPVQQTPLNAMTATTLAGRLFIFTLANGRIGRNSADVTGHWESDHPLALDGPAATIVEDIAACTFNAEILLTVVSKDTVWLATQPAGSPWGAFSVVPSTGLPAGTKRIACAAASGHLLIFVASSAGLWMTARSPGMTWNGTWTEVTARLGGTAGAAVACVAAGSAANSATVHLFASFGGKVSHARVTGSGMWQPAEAVDSGLTDVTDLACAVRDEASVILTAATPSGPVGVTRNAMGWAASTGPIAALPQKVSRVSAGILSGTVLAAAS